MLEIDVDSATADLKSQSFEFGFPLRPYQRLAIEKVESELAHGKRNMLLAMATGTGKTKLAIAMLYRLLAAKRFRRVCFVVDRNALGTQAAGEFSTTRIVSAKTFADIFGLKGLDTIKPDPETKVHICTIQGLVKRVIFAEDISDTPPIDQYDLMVVDECHRGYLLDRELSDAELSFRSQDDYISKYRRVLEHFDAVKIGLTATPALHTVDIFGDPVFKYSYREAVVDGYLIDHEPPIQITTALSQAGIKFKKGEKVEMIDTRTGKIDLAHTPDEIKFDVDEFNKAVITVPFNKAVAGELARHIDPNLPGKTLIFAVSDAHADIVVEQLKKAFAAAYGDIEDAAIRKITGSVDRPGRQILSFRNDALPKIAVTVDLLTTGIDVPSIENLVFLRRVNSRILYEQMLGRATRQCPEIGKETFRIFDAVDLYPHLQHLTEMKPVVVEPNITFERMRQRNRRVDKGSGWGYWFWAAQAVGVSSASR
jgi:type I restriction enzyme R subunit